MCVGVKASQRGQTSRGSDTSGETSRKKGRACSRSGAAFSGPRARSRASERTALKRPVLALSGGASQQRLLELSLRACDCPPAASACGDAGLMRRDDGDAATGDRAPSESHRGTVWGSSSLLPVRWGLLYSVVVLPFLPSFRCAHTHTDARTPDADVDAEGKKVVGEWQRQRV